MCPAVTRCAIRRVIVRVFPVPAPASTHTGPRGARTASRCSSSRPGTSTLAASVSSGMTSIMAGLGHKTRPAPPCRTQRASTISNLCHSGDKSGPRGITDAVVFVKWLMTVGDAPLTVYTTSWCGYCLRLKTVLKADGISYTEIDIEINPEAADFVASVNGGNRTVPTVKFADGSTLTNPGAREVKQKLAESAAN